MKFPAARAAALAFASLALAPVSRILAATYAVPPDAALVRQAGLIVRGRVLDGASLRDASGAIVTDVRIAVETVLKGEALLNGEARGVLTIRQPGGVLGDEMTVYPGLGEFGVRDHLLLFLEPQAGAPPRLLHFALGKFVIDTAPDGSEYAWRPEVRTARTGDGGRWIEPARELRAFESFVADLVSGRLEPEAAAARAGDYVLPGFTPPEFTAQPRFELLDLGSNEYARWLPFDSDGSINYRDDTVGEGGANCPTGCHTETAAGVSGWNAEPTSSIQVVMGASDASIGSKCMGALSNEVNYDDPCGEITDLSGCSGTLAVGGFSATLAQTSSGCAAKSSDPYYKITEARIMVNNGVGGCLNSCDFQDMITHETGHTLGFGHSSDNTAIMAPFIVHGVCGVLQADDIAGASCLYPGSGVCIPADLTLVKVKEKTTGAVKLKVFGTTFAAGDLIQVDSGGGFASVLTTVFKSKKKLYITDASAVFPDMSTVMVRVIKAGGCTGTELPATR